MIKGDKSKAAPVKPASKGKSKGDDSLHTGDTIEFDV